MAGRRVGGPVACWALCLGASLQAGEPPPRDPGDVARAVAAAARTGDAAGLHDLAAADEPDPWQIADALLASGDAEAAAAYAAAAPRAATAALPAYVAAQRAARADPERRKRLLGIQAQLGAGSWQEVSAALDAEGSLGQDVLGVLAASWKAYAQSRLGRPAEAVRAWDECADAARGLGWVRQEMEAASNAAMDSLGIDPGGAKQRALRSLALAERIDHKLGTALALRHAAVAHARLEEPAEARALFERLAEAASRIGWSPGQAEALHGIAMAWLSVGDLSAARAGFERAREFSQRMGDARNAAAALLNIGITHQHGGSGKEALRHFEAAGAEYEAAGDSRGVASALGEIGTALKGLGEHGRALETLQRARQAKLAVGDAWGAARTLGNIADVHWVLGDLSAALAAREQSLAESTAVGDRPGVALSLGSLAQLHRHRGDLARASECLERARAEFEGMGREGDLAGVLLLMADLHLARGEYAAALAMAQQVVARAEGLGDRLRTTQALLTLGALQEEGGDFPRALATLRRGLGVAESLDAPAQVLEALTALGHCHLALGDYALALSHHERALGTAERHGDRPGAIGARLNIGNVLFTLGSYAEARAVYERGLAEVEAEGNLFRVSQVLGNLGAIHLMLEEHEQALGYSRRALELRERIGHRRGVPTALSNMAGSERKLGRHAEALALYERALATAEEVGDRALQISIQTGIGKTHRLLGDLSRARAVLERAVRSAKSLRAGTRHVSALAALARVHLEAGESSRALSAVQQALRELEGMLGGLGEEEGASARSTLADLFETGVLAAAREEDPAEMFAILESGRAGALLDALGKREALRWQAETLPEEVRAAEARARGRQRQARADYDRALAASPRDRKTVAAAARALEEAEEEVRAAHARIQREVKRAAGLYYPRVRSLEDAQAALEEGEALVLYGLCLEEAVALVVRPDGERIVGLGDRKSLEEACEAFDAPARAPEAGAALAGLRKRLVEPLSLEPDVRRVLVSPDGALAVVPFGALFDLPLALTPSGTTHVLLAEEETESGEGVLALGDPDYAAASTGAQAVYFRGRSLTPLPATRPEAEALGTKVLLGPEASEEGLRAALPGARRWRSVHFACHGLVDPERPTLSSLALSRAGEEDGFLTALEVGRMQIAADLAVLSACETGRGKVVRAEGIVGLTRAFMYAGTPRVLCSLWKVDDEATSALMTRFYELWTPKDGSPGLPAAEALRKAQEFVRSQERWKHPYYWAAWVLWGLP